METIERGLGRVPFLQGLSAAERRRIAEKVEVRDYPAGATIVAQGDEGRTLYIILSGRVRVVRHRRSGEEGANRATTLAEFGPGEFFGEMALLEQTPRTADVIALTPTTCALLGQEIFRDDLLGNHEVAAALLATLSRRLRAQAELLERPRVETKAPPRERERRILEGGEAAMAADIRNALVVKEHNHFTLFDPEGNIPIGNAAGLGLYLGDTRHLSGYEVSLGKVQPVVLVSTAQLGYAAELQLTNRDLTIRRRTVRKETLLVSRERLAHDAGFYEQITLRNFNQFPVQVEVHVRFAADFADIFEVRGIGRPRRGGHRPPHVDGGGVTLAYDGLDGRCYETALTFTPPPDRLTGATATERVEVPPLGKSELRVDVTARVVTDGAEVEGRSPGEAPAAAAQIARAKHSYEEWLGAATGVTTGNELFDAAIARSLADLRLLVNRLDGHWYFAAGIPWYATLFGRDSLITGLQTLAWNPELAAGILQLLARYQGTKDDGWRDEEPGKILHELRSGELARTNRVPHTPYYGTIDATPLFLMLAAAYWDWTGDAATLRGLLPNIDAALGWCGRHGDLDGDGFIEYARRSSKGLANQGWRDSGEGIMFGDGRLPEPPIALVEVQGYLYAAYRGVARVLRGLGDVPGGEARARDLDGRAARLKERFNRDFWLPDAGFYALGLDGRKRRIDAITPNPGQALWTGIVDEARAPAVVARLLGEELFSGWGIRTLARGASAYNPLGYHLGTVWPHDNSLIAAGMARFGFVEEANRVLTALYEAALQFPYYRLPELFCGIPRTDYGVPVGYPVACSPQAWAAAALPYMLSETLGLHPTDGGRGLHVVRPVLPAWLGDVRLRGLRVGATRLDLTFTPGAAGEPARVAVEWRDGAGVDVQVVDAPPH
ncbi:MAG: cyclic nucleotide-binding domain-containing protein [Chloroflexota bacterium]|nr:cyclic nucleotide-binding domain-containing protein [Chloroflexota bacterium]